MRLRAELSLAAMNARSQAFLPGHFGMRVTAVSARELAMQRDVRHRDARVQRLSACRQRGVALADTACGYAILARLSDGAESFTTIELKTNFLGTAMSGTLAAVARAAHGGRNTQVWDATVTEVASGRQIALFRCTPMVLYPKP